VKALDGTSLLKNTNQEWLQIHLPSQMLLCRPAFTNHCRYRPSHPNPARGPITKRLTDAYIAEVGCDFVKQYLDRLS
jgi:hypothetical protein